jgi:hypothetical protein
MQTALDGRAIQGQTRRTMKFLIPLGLLTASLFLTGCDTLVVERHPVVVHDHYYGGYYGPRPYARTDVVVVDHPGYRPGPYYGAPHGVVYYTDKHGRFYWSHGHKVYVKRW